MNRAIARLFAIAFLISLGTILPFDAGPRTLNAAPVQNNENLCGPTAIDRSVDQPARINPVQPDQLVPTTSPAVEPPEAAGNSGSYVFSDDFEAYGDARRWRTTDTVVSNRQNPQSGEYAVTAEGSTTTEGAFSVVSLDGGYSELYSRVGVHVVDQGDTTLDLMSFRRVTGRALITVEISTTGTLAIFSWLDNHQAISTQQISHGTWMDIQVALSVSTQNATYSVQVWLNDDPVPGLDYTRQFDRELAGDLAAESLQVDGPIRQFEIGDSAGGQTYEVIYDNAIVATRKIAASAVPDPFGGVLTIQTAPAIPGVVFEAQGQFYTADEQGVATLTIPRISPNLSDIVSIPPVLLDDGSTVTIGRWYFGNDDRSEAVVTLNQFYPVQLSFVDLLGRPVETSRIKSLTFKSSVGVYFVFTGEEITGVNYMQGSRMVPSVSGLDLKELYFTLESACVAGTSVVNRSKHRVEPSIAGDRRIEMLFYSASFTSQDALLGYTTGSSIDLEFPDGHIQTFPLDADGHVRVSSLPRGDYQVRVNGPGYSPPRPVAITRDQFVELEVVTYVDMALVVALVLITSVGALLIGRPVFYRLPIQLVAGAFSAVFGRVGPRPNR